MKALPPVYAVVKNSGVEIPIIDMSAPTDEIIEQMWDASQNVGFFNMINHGIPQDDIDHIFALSREFFAQSVNEKKKYPFDVPKNSGYEYKSQAPPSTKTVDQKESMQITAREGCMDSLWPEHPPNFRTKTEEMMSVTHELACTILSMLEAKACPHLEPGTLVNSHHIWNESGQCMLRLMQYPPVDGQLVLNDGESGYNNLWRAGPHTDWGCITLLFQRMGEEGLECCAGPSTSGGTGDDTKQWIEVPPVPQGITCNICDMLKRWSDSTLLSNMHRVRMPRNKEECTKSRYSVAFFLQADTSAVIESTTKEPITAKDYFAGRINSHFSQ